MRKSTFRFFGASAAAITAKTTKIADEMAHRAHLAEVKINNFHLKQLGGIELSDHKPFEFSDTISWNIMMQGNGKNTGFAEVETHEVYRKRYTLIARQVAQWLKKKNVKRVDLQEFVINTSDQREFQRILAEEGLDVRVHHTRSFPVASIIHKDGPFKIADETQDLFSADNPDMRGRFLIFRSSSNSYHINAHFPFNKTEVAFKQFYITLFKHLAETLEEGLDTVSVHVNADSNLLPEQQKKLLQEAFDAVKTDRLVKNVDSSFSATSYVLTSPGSHLKQEDGKKFLVSVDSAHLLVLSAAKNYNYHQAIDETPEDSKKLPVTVDSPNLLALSSPAKNHSYHQATDEAPENSKKLPATDEALEDSKKFPVIVDSAHLLVLSAAKNYSYHQATDEESHEYFYHYLVSGAVIGCGTVLNLVEDDFAAIALTGNAATFFSAAARAKATFPQERRLIADKCDLWP